MTSRTALPTHPFRAPERALPAKTRLDEFEIETVLAQGSFGIVYRAYDHVLKLHVAIKEYLPDALALRSAETQVVLRQRAHGERFDQGLQAFIIEAQTLARCEHPSLLRIVRLLRRHGTAYRVMRYSPGPTLLEHRRELGATPDAPTMRAWLDALLGALDTLHEEGCVHAAVAPGNILLLPDDRPMLLDFEAVRSALISDRTQSMMAALEPCFEPIEQRAPSAGSMLGPWTDLYSLAATLHFAVGGQLPAPPSAAGAAPRFESLHSLWLRQRLVQPGLAEAPPWLDAIDACLREDPQQRPQSVVQLRALLHDAAAPAEPPQRAPAAPEAAALPPGVPVLDLQRDAFTLPRAASPGASAAPTAHAVPPPAAAGAAQAAAPLDPAHAAVIADLDKTFAFIAAQATEDANPKPQAEASEPAASEGAGTAAAAEGPAAPRPLSHLQQMMAGAVALLFLVGMGFGTWWLVGEAQPGLVGAGHSPALQSGVTLPRGAGTPSPADDATARALEAAAAALERSPPRAGREPPPAAKAPEVPPAPPTPPAPPAPPAKAKAKAKAPAITSPRQACDGRARFALYECMQTQCSKRSWRRHAQCVEFRRNQKL